MNDLLEHRALTWKLNWYRHSELEGALLLGRMARIADDPFLIHELTRHAAEEARHAWLWAKAIDQLDLACVRILRSYQSFYLEHTGALTRMTEVLALTHVFELRVDRRFREELENPAIPAPARRTFRKLILDEQRHLDWVREWLKTQPEGEDLVRRFQEVDEIIHRSLLPAIDRLWEVPGLGEELAPVGVGH